MADAASFYHGYRDTDMDALSSRVGGLFTIGLFTILITALIVAVGYTWWSGCSLPTYESFSVMGTPPPGPGPPNAMAAQIMANPESTMAEGFFTGPAKGSGEPDCLHTSSEAAELYAILASKTQTTEEGPDDLRELRLILSKIACFKRDLMGAARVVEATRYQPFSTAHDLEPVAETTARCFAKTIPQRDLQLSLDKWGSRGTFLIKRLCTSLALSGPEEDEVLRLFGDAMGDVSNVALGVCCSGTATLAGEPVAAPRMVPGFEPPQLVGLREYGGYY